MNRFQHVTGVVFDMDGVLVDTSHCHDQAYRCLMNQAGLPSVDYAILAGRSTREVIASYFPDSSHEEQRKWVAFKQYQALELIKTADIVYDDTIDVVRSLHEHGYRLGMGTSASRQSAMMVLERLGLGAVFTSVVTADDVTHTKPDPEIFNRVMADLDLDPRATLIVEDSEAGVNSGLATGADVVNVRHQLIRADANGYRGFYPDLATLRNEILENRP